MAYVDFILNLAGLLLWAKWRSLPFDPFNHRTPATLVGTLRRAAPSPFRRWHLLAVIGALVVLRAVFYWQIGSTATPAWVGRLDFEATNLPFASNSFGRMFLFSMFSFARALAVFYVWLLLLSIVASPTTQEQSAHRLVRMQLGRVDGWPRGLKIMLPLGVTALAWGVATWPFAWMHPGQTLSLLQRLEESLVIGLGSYLAWKAVVVALLVLHLLNTYIYFGRHPFWKYVNATVANLLTPLRKIPLQVGRMDFAPVVGMAVIFLTAELAERGLIRLYARLPF